MSSSRKLTHAAASALCSDVDQELPDIMHHQVRHTCTRYRNDGAEAFLRDIDLQTPTNLVPPPTAQQQQHWMCAQYPHIRAAKLLITHAPAKIIMPVRQKQFRSAFELQCDLHVSQADGQALSDGSPATQFAVDVLAFTQDAASNEIASDWLSLQEAYGHVVMAKRLSVQYTQGEHAKWSVVAGTNDGVDYRAERDRVLTINMKFLNLELPHSGMEPIRLGFMLRIHQRCIEVVTLLPRTIVLTRPVEQVWKALKTLGYKKPTTEGLETNPRFDEIIKRAARCNVIPTDDTEADHREAPSMSSAVTSGTHVASRAGPPAGVPVHVLPGLHASRGPSSLPLWQSGELTGSPSAQAMHAEVGSTANTRTSCNNLADVQRTPSLPSPVASKSLSYSQVPMPAPSSDRRAAPTSTRLQAYFDNGYTYKAPQGVPPTPTTAATTPSLAGQQSAAIGLPSTHAAAVAAGVIPAPTGSSPTRRQSVCGMPAQLAGGAGGFPNGSVPFAHDSVAFASYMGRSDPRHGVTFPPGAAYAEDDASVGGLSPTRRCSAPGGAILGVAGPHTTPCSATQMARLGSTPSSTRASHQSFTARVPSAMSTDSTHFSFPSSDAEPFSTMAYLNGYPPGQEYNYMGYSRSHVPVQARGPVCGGQMMEGVCGEVRPRSRSSIGQHPEEMMRMMPVARGDGVDDMDCMEDMRTVGVRRNNWSDDAQQQLKRLMGADDAAHMRAWSEANLNGT